MLAHDAQCAAAGVTTVLDALCLGDLGFDKDRIRTFRDGVADLDALADTGLLKSEHFLHLRCELPAPDMMELLDPVADHPRVRMVSLMDHSPGVGQYADLDHYRAHAPARGRHDGVDRAAHPSSCRSSARGCASPNRRALLARVARPRRACWPATTTAPRRRSRRTTRDGIRISEFPVTHGRRARRRRRTAWR